MLRDVRFLLLSAALCLAGAQGGAIAAAADDHGRPEARPAAPSGRPAAASGPRPGVTAVRAAPDGRGQILDQRYNHGRYYPPVGTVRASLPGEYRPYFRGGQRFYFNAGVWYAPRGSGFVVVTPPPGLVVSMLPPYYSTVWIGGNPYYYADSVYYSWQPDQSGYEVVDPPQNADQPAAPPDAPQPTVDDPIVYPKKSQSSDQQAADQYECHQWAQTQTGFDPTQPGGGVPAEDLDRTRSNYYRAMSACLQGRDYEVN